MNCYYIFTIFFAITLLTLGFVTSIEALENNGQGAKSKYGQLEAVEEAKQNLNTIVKPVGHVDENLLRQRRQTIDEVLTNYQNDANNEALDDNGNEILEKDDNDEGAGGDGMDRNWFRQSRSHQNLDNEMRMWNKQNLRICIGDDKCNRVENQERFKSNPPLSEYKSLENFLSQTKLDANDILNGGISSYTNEEKSSNKEDTRKQKNNNADKNVENSFGKNDKPYHNDLLIAFNNRYNKAPSRGSDRTVSNKNNNEFKFLDHNSLNYKDHYSNADYPNSAANKKQKQKESFDSNSDYFGNFNTNNQYSSQNTDESLNNNQQSHSHRVNYKPLNEETLKYLSKHHMKFDLVQTTTQPTKLKETKEEEEDELYAFRYPVGILRGTELDAKENTNLTVTVNPIVNYRSDLYDTSGQQREDQTMDTSLWGDTNENSAYTSYNDQLDNTQNNLSHEANYKLSKVEQDASEKKKDFKWKWGNVKRSTRFNPMDEIKLKTSSRLMTKGFGPSLPSYSLGEARRDLLIENVLKRKEKQLKRGYTKTDFDRNQPLYEKQSYEKLMEHNKRLEDFGREPLYPVLMPMATNNWNYIRRKRISENIKTQQDTSAGLKENTKEETKVEVKDQEDFNDPLKSSKLNTEGSKEASNEPNEALKLQETETASEGDGKLRENSDSSQKDNSQAAKLKDDNTNNLENVNNNQDTKRTQKREEMILKMNINPVLNKDANNHRRRKRSLDSEIEGMQSLKTENLNENIYSALSLNLKEFTHNDSPSLKVLKRVKRYRPIEALDLKIYQRFHSPKAMQLNRYKPLQNKQYWNKKPHNKINRSKRSCNENSTNETTTANSAITERSGTENDETLSLKKNKSSKKMFKEKQNLRMPLNNRNNEEVNKNNVENKVTANLQSLTHKIWKTVKDLPKRIKVFFKTVYKKLCWLKCNNTTLIKNENETFFNISFATEEKNRELELLREDQANELSSDRNFISDISQKTGFVNKTNCLERIKRQKRSVFENKNRSDKFSLAKPQKDFPLKEKLDSNKNFKKILRSTLTENPSSKTTENDTHFKNTTSFQVANRQKRSFEFVPGTDFDNFELNEDDFINSIERAAFKRTRRSLNSNRKENPIKQRLMKRNINDIDEIFKPTFDMNYLNNDLQTNSQDFEDFQPNQDFDFLQTNGQEKYPQDIFTKLDTDFKIFNTKRDTSPMNNDLNLLSNLRQNAETKPDFDFENIHAAFNKEEFDNMKQEEDPKLKQFEDMKFDNMLFEHSKQKQLPKAGRTGHSKFLLPFLNAKKALHKSFLKSQYQFDTPRCNNNKRQIMKTNIKTAGKTNFNSKIKDTKQKKILKSYSDKSVDKMKHNNLNDLKNFNQNYKFNENHYSWRQQPNIHNGLNTMNQEIQDTQTSEDPNKLVLSGRNEILNCKAFTSLENFLKSLSNNATELQSENPNTEKNDITPLPNETTTICVPQNTTKFPTIDETSSTEGEPTSTEADSTSSLSPDIEEETPTESPDIPENPVPEINIETVDSTENTTECIPQSSSSSSSESEAESEADVQSSSTESTLDIPTTSAFDPDEDVKLNITINANVRGNKKDKKFFGNGTFNVIPGISDDRIRREIFSHPFDEMQKQRCALKPTAGPHDVDDNNDISNLASGKLSANVVRNVFDMVRNCPKLKVLWPSLKRNQIEAKPAIQNLYAIRNQDNENKVKESEQLLTKAMETINAIIDEQVRSRTCVPLRPDLKDFYDLILKTRQEQDRCREKRHIARAKNEADFSEEVRSMDPNKIEEESKTVKKLLKQYEDLPEEDQQEAAAVRDELLRDLSVLRKIKEFEERRKRDLREQKELDLDLSDEEVMKRLETQYTPQFLKLLKAADLYREITSDTEPQL